MVNAGMVNARTSYFSPTTFCESFRVFDRIPRFQNPFKYIGRLQINLGRSAPLPQLLLQFNALAAKISH
jgi:hypothetical protein